MSGSADRVPERAPCVVHELEEPEQTVLCDAEQSQLLALNDVGAAIWHLIDGNRSVRQIAAVVASHFDAAPEQVLADVTEFLETLEARALIAFAAPPARA